MQNHLFKLVDASLLPAALMVVGKVAGLMAAIAFFQLPWGIRELPGSLLSVRPTFLTEDILLASTYSDLIMFIFLAAGFTIILIQATHFHETHINPQLLTKLVNTNLFGLVGSSFGIYHRAAVWLLFMWLSLFVIGLNIFTARTEWWVGVIGLITSIVLTTALLQDVYREIEIGKREVGSQPAL